MEIGFLLALLAVLGLIFLGMMGIVFFSGVIEGRLPPEKQGRPYSGARPKDYRNH